VPWLGEEDSLFVGFGHLELSSNNRNNENENKKMDNCADFDFLDLS